MTVLVFGKTGQVAQALALHDTTLCLSRKEADLARPECCAEAIRRIRPGAVINAAAYTTVDKAEQEETLATTINAAAPAAMATACAEQDIPFVTISTDYVFDGQGNTPHAPHATTAPLNAYGRSKLAGETRVAAAGGRWAVLRTSWVFAPGGANFATTMLRLSETRDSLSIVADQVGGPTPASAIASACLTMAEALNRDQRKSGLYHFSGTPDVSWADFARTIFDMAGRNCAVTDIPTAHYPTPARRPLNSRLDCSSLHATFGIAQPDWREALPAVIETYRRTAK